MKPKQWLWGLAALPVICVPLIAQESRPQAPAAPTEAPVTTPPAATPPAATATNADTPEPAAQQPVEPEDERLSADNTLSFPVDI